MDAIDYLIERANERRIKLEKIKHQTDFKHTPSEDEVQVFYHSAEWKKLRRLILKRDYGNDQIELREHHRVMKGNVAHHIYPLRDYWELRAEPLNLEIVSPQNHNIEHPEKAMPADKRKQYKQFKAKEHKAQKIGAVVKIANNEELF